ncbi:hypothetical protein LSAT2_013005 [Lamellibrachia satsuma]|nr:hypothetical protein LSAT2_013005 [Lamellibrachia satsuma]
MGFPELYWGAKVQQGAKTVAVRIVDTDVVVIFVGLIFSLKATIGNFQLWVAFGRGRSIRNIHINIVCDSLWRAEGQVNPDVPCHDGL